MTEDYLLYKHAEVVDYPEPHPPAKEGDTLLLRVCYSRQPAIRVSRSAAQSVFCRLKTTACELMIVVALANRR